MQSQGIMLKPLPGRRRRNSLKNQWPFCFWLRGYENHDPAKAEQYKRWRGSKKVQEENEKKSAEAHSLK